MRIHITRRGGLAGVALSAELDTDDLDGETGERVAELVERLAAAGPAEAPPPHPDAFVYEIGLPERGQSVSVGESELPEDLRPVLRGLVKPA